MPSIHGKKFGGETYDYLREPPAPPGCGLVPHGGARAAAGHYRRTHGVKHLFGALDLTTGRLCYRIRDCKRWQEFLAFLKVLRARFDERLYIVVDNF